MQSSSLPSYMSIIAHQNLVEPRLPSFAEATGQTENDPCRLPSYRETRRARFHPYARFAPIVVDETERLLNTIYDEERVELNVPPARVGYRPTPFVLHPRPEVDEEMRRQIESAIAFERRIHRLQGVMLEFVAAVRRARG